MGFAISWIGVRGRSKDAVLADLQAVDTGQTDPGMKARRFCAELSNGWLIIFSNRFDYASPQRIADLSAGGLALGCAVEEHVMFSEARAYEDGRELWSVVHDSAEGGAYHLATDGKVPAELAPIRERLKREQDEEGGDEAGVDFLFDAPVELAAAICGFRHDQDADEPGAPVFTALRELGTSSSGGGLLQRLGGFFRRG